MLIHLNKSKLFTVDPAIRFAKAYDVPVELWQELWKRHKLMDFTNREMREYFQFKAGKRINRMNVSRWIFRSEIYSIAKPMMKEGVRTVNSAFFQHNEQKVINEIVKHMRFGVTKDSRTIV